MNLVLLDAGAVDDLGCAVLTGRAATHIRQVLRAAPGDELLVGLLGGLVGTGRILAMAPAGGAIEIQVTWLTAPPPPLGIDLLLALPRPKTLRRLLRAAASMGVKRIVLVNAARVDKSYFHSPLLAPEHTTAALREGLEQARDTMLPEIQIEPRFRPFVEDRAAALWPDPTLRLVAHPGLQSSRTLAAGPVGAVLAIGPDGGWVHFELELLATHGFQPFSMGPRALRVDVAAVAALAQVELLLRSR